MAKVMERQAALDRIVAVLQPYLGATMAEASTRAHCEKLGIGAGTISEQHLDALLAKLRGGLAVFVGREQAGRIMDEIRASLASGNPS
jgi:hypothetical protein